MKIPFLFRRLALLLPLFCLSLMAQATHFRYGSLTYQTGGANNRTAQFKLSVAFREDFFGAPPVVGQLVPDVGYLDFGDGTDVLFGVTVTAVGADYFYGEFNTSHTYASSGNFRAIYTGGDRISTLQNNPDGLWYISTVVNAGSTNASPVSTLPPIVNLATGQASASYLVPTADPNGNALTYSIATSADLGGITFVNAPGISVNPTTGLVTFSTVGRTIGQLFNAVIKVSDGSTSIVVDHIIQIVGQASTPPTFVYPPTPTNGQVYAVSPGQNVTFTVRATDSNAGDIVTLQALGLPAGATMAPALPLNGNPVQSVFSWTPTAANIGSTVINFLAQDNNGAQTSTSVTVQVAAACNPTANQPVANSDQITATCTPLVITAAQLLANDTNPLGGSLQITGVSQPSNGTLVANGNGTYTYTPAPGFNGTATFTYQVQSLSLGPVLALPATGHYYEFVNVPGGICWTGAQSAAAARNFQGLTGYLATVTSATETNFLRGRNSGQYWFGAADNLIEGEWRWKTGPEAGQLFWNGGPSGPAVQYSNWSANEPNDFKNTWRLAGEDYAQFYGASGLWNDLDECGTGTTIAGYIVEYGGLEACTPILYATGTVTISVPAGPTLPVANPDQFGTASGSPLIITSAQLLANDTDPLNRILQVSSVGNPSSGSLVTNGNGTFTFTPAAGFTGTATFTYVVQPTGPVLASATTGHYYEYVSAANICWTTAQTAAAARTYNGLTGYLATITSAAETSLLKGRNSGQYWFGAADNLVEGEWRWKTGPEAGQLFWNGGPSGPAVQYSNWSANEPDDFKNIWRPAGEDYAQFYGASGLWNDLDECGTGTTIAGYIVEYGGLEACTPVLYSTGTVTITVSGGSTSRPVVTTQITPTVLEAAPNPNNGQFRVRVIAGAECLAKLDLYDLQGRRVSTLFEGTLQFNEQREVPVNLSDISSGIYMVQLQSGQRVQYVRVIIHK